jgi:hypothetical protein
MELSQVWAERFAILPAILPRNPDCGSDSAMPILPLHPLSGWQMSFEKEEFVGHSASTCFWRLGHILAA